MPGKFIMLVGRIILLCTAVLFTLPVLRAADLAVSNHQSGSSVRYPVVLLRGTLPADSRQLQIRNHQAPAQAADVAPVVHEGRFKALVELTAGNNTIELHCLGHDSRLMLDLHYLPQTNPCYVRLIWMTDNSGDTTFAAPSDDVPQDYQARLRTAAQLMQTFTAERLHDLGFGRKTFRLERDDRGQIVVHTLNAPEDKEFYYQLGDSNRWWQNVYSWINREHPDPFAKNIVLAAYTRKDPETGQMKGHTALGGGNLGLFGSASVFSWPRDLSTTSEVFHDRTRVDPTSVHDDSAGRGTYWGVASTTIGATLHEMGHTFGLPHCRDGMGIMTRGFDHFNRVFTFYDPPGGRNRTAVYFTPEQEAYFATISASFLQWSPWFRLDNVDDTDSTPARITFHKDKGTVEFSAESGVPWIGFWVGGDVHAHREFDAEAVQTTVTMSLDEIRNRLDGKPLSRVSTIARNGQSTTLTIDQQP
ncbi:MAG: hypothetical protein RIK87_00990 [Fuerstiella sp.]